MCEQKRGVPVGAIVAALAAVGAVSLAAAWLAGVWPLLLAGAVVAGAVCAGLAWASRWLARLAVVNWPSHGWRESPVVLRARLELTAARPALERSRPVVATVLSRHDEVRRGLQ